ncbi:DUF4381 domain-containing protein [Amantichitinum ursilacus]|uniref:DUF4381 domain-containing protein n=1 Tax=Amantichitinum ursilacus TaxID=857265 RepID=A0A0N0GRE7_9NEIS|nr:DUF4381 domain-containing protein [Amantichitinum ursilacus]KPC55359.1 hypothetical protein WG78_01840 [Amantichitinum ursilacus]
MSALVHSVAADPTPVPVNASAVLAQLQNAAMPAPVPYTPQTWGWAVLAALLVIVLAWLVWRCIRRYRALAWRRAALAELRQIETEWQHSQPEALRRLPALVKRVALQTAPRAQVASLSGTAWLAWLDGHDRRKRFSTGPGQWLLTLTYSAETPPQAEVSALLRQLRHWIGRQHAGV